MSSVQQEIEALRDALFSHLSAPIDGEEARELALSACERMAQSLMEAQEGFENELLRAHGWAVQEVEALLQDAQEQARAVGERTRERMGARADSSLRAIEALREALDRELGALKGRLDADMEQVKAAALNQSVLAFLSYKRALARLDAELMEKTEPRVVQAELAQIRRAVKLLLDSVCGKG